MFEKRFKLNEEIIPVVKEIGKHLPGGFFIYKADGDMEVLYINDAAIEIFGCESQEQFRELTGYTFKGMVYPEDYDQIQESIGEQIADNEDRLDHVEYRIKRRDGALRWVDDYGHYTETVAYGGVYLVFISDITEKRERMETDMAIRQAVIEALSESYHTVWLINDVETESFSLYRGDVAGETEHAAPILAALRNMKYSRAKEYYIATTVAECDRERLNKELALPEIVRRLQERPQFSVNYLRTMEDGSERYFRIEFAKVDMPGGKLGVVCGFKDVDTDVRQGQAIQKALREAEKAEAENQRLMQEIASAADLAELMSSASSLLTNMPAMSFSKDAETGVYLACNQAFAEYAHKESPEQVVGLTDYDIFDPVTAQHFVEDDKKALSMDSAYIFFEDVPDAGGKIIRNLQTTKIKFTDTTGRECLLGMCVDVTEMTRIKFAEAESKARQEDLEQQLRLQEQLLEQEKLRAERDSMITAMASDYRSVYHVDLDEDEAVCYRADPEDPDRVEEGARFPFHETFERYGRQYVSEQDLAGFLSFIDPDHIRQALATEKIIAYRYLANRGGRSYYEMLRMAGVRHPADRDDHIVHAVGVGFTVIDEEMRQTIERNRALSEALSAAEEANRAKTAFLSNMSHEIRTPMNAIIGLNNIALSNPNLSEVTRDQLEKIGISAQHLLSIINDILDMSRIESGRMTIHPEEFSFTRALEQVNTMIGGQCRDKGLTYESQILNHVSSYYIGDDMKLRQILINILGNAVKFTPEGGTVRLTVEELARFDGNATLRFVISDNGIGMSPEFLPTIFDTFTQEDSTASNRYGSTGLGMPITKNLVELMNGQIEVESEKNVGTTFVVTITLKESDRQDDEGQGGELHPHELSVLVIDDDPVACEHAELVLGQAGISCDTASSGTEGVEMVRLRHARQEPYNLILVDWKMPDMDGVETTRQIRDAIGHETAIVILTSYDWGEIAEEARAAGVDSFVSKPLIADSVMDEFWEAFRRKSAAYLRQKADLTGRRILLAEDVLVNAEIMSMVLGLREMEVEHAENGQIAVDLYLQHEPGYYDAILMDMRMPVMDGLEATRLIRAAGRTDSKMIPIIALTANAFDEDVQRSMQAGLNAHLSKPVEPDSLYETLENLIG
ncbi:MAG: response regulator [Lachnospiraceae bacterium]|nr:response regulator [Lachnospiraceae bacterium]